jgi:hypothetical protein
MNKVRTDKEGNYIGDGAFHNQYHIEDMSMYADVDVRLEKSNTSESVYVVYTRAVGSEIKSIKVRFSNHNNNGVRLGMELDGNFASREEILYHLDYATREFIPQTQLMIASRQVKKVLIPTFEECDKTMRELYAMGKDADLSAYVGKLAKGSNYLIQGTKVEEHFVKRLDAFGNEVFVGHYNYTIL